MLTSGTSDKMTLSFLIFNVFYYRSGTRGLVIVALCPVCSSRTCFVPLLAIHIVFYEFPVCLKEESELTFAGMVAPQEKTTFNDEADRKVLCSQTPNPKP